MHLNITKWSGVFKILGDPTRLTLLHTIHYAGQNTLSVGALAEETGLRVATVSAALRAMENNGTVKSLRDGRHIYYAISSEEIHDLLHWMGSTHASDAHPDPHT